MTREEARKHLEFLKIMDAPKLREAVDMAIEALGKMDEIIKILDDTDFHNAESLNEIGEDKGYHEAICAISLEADRKYRWLYD